MMKAPSLKRQLISLFFALLVVLPLAILYREFFAESRLASGVTLRTQDYQGWTNSLVLENSEAEVVVVPAVGRVMQFRFKSGSGPFWENESMHGKLPDPLSADWGNFGGDKAWPSPQSDWPKQTPRAWPPPPAFDSMPVEAEIKGSKVILRSAVDPFYGIRTEREVVLDPSLPRMTLVTTFERVTASTVAPSAALTNAIGVWIITQLQEPLAVFMPVAKGPLFPEGYRLQSDAPPTNLNLENGLLSLTRDSELSHKVGNDAGTLIWVGDRVVLRIDSPRQIGAEYPDQGSSAEVYTNPGPLNYVELEMLAPLHEMKPGDRFSQTNVYTLFRRKLPTPAEEARRVLGH